MTTGEFQVVLVSQIPHLRERAMRLCGAEADAADLVQSALLKALVRGRQLPEPGSVRHWLRRVLQNLFIDGWRARTKTGPADPEPDELPAVEREEEPGWTVLDGKSLQRAMVKLPPQFREVYRLHVEGLAYDEIALRLAIPPATVGTRLFRARRKLRELLKQDLALRS